MKYEQTLLKIVKVLKRLRIYKLEGVSKLVRLANFRLTTLLALMGKGENSLRKIEDKLKNPKC